ncbi:Arc family DNA-binding protein [Pseudogemmobacter sonorensis]|uniref:Arc family DNA-binding protein n=1 Tax=Pseudogemmobacter sonorensis TaxID=2989681 RepID=UPI0036D10141
MAQESESRSLDKVIVRLPDGMRDRIKAAAEGNNRSMNAEIVARLDGSFTQSPEEFVGEAAVKIQAGLDALKEQADHFQRTMTLAQEENRRFRDAYAKAMRFLLDNMETLPRPLVEATIGTIIPEAFETEGGAGSQPAPFATFHESPPFVVEEILPHAGQGERGATQRVDRVKRVQTKPKGGP